MNKLKCNYNNYSVTSIIIIKTPINIRRKLDWDDFACSLLLDLSLRILYH